MPLVKAVNFPYNTFGILYTIEFTFALFMYLHFIFVFICILCIYICVYVFLYLHCIMLLQLPTAIADNAGYDSSELISNLRAAHAKGNNTAGLGEH